MREVSLAAFLLLVTLLPVCPARADGPHIAFHGTGMEGATMTLFSAPDPLVTGPVTLTLLVQSSADGPMLAGASARGSLTLPGHDRVAFTMARGSGSDRQLPVVSLTLPAAGAYALELVVQVPGQTPDHFSAVLPVETNHGQRNTVLWAVFVPVVLAGLFLLNQQGKVQMRRRRLRS